MSRATPPRQNGFNPHQPGVDYGVLDALLGYAVRRAQIRITQAFDARLSDAGMTTQRFSALVLIARNPGRKQAELAAIMGIARSGALAIVESLDAQGLVERRPSPDDGRAQALYLTALGERSLPGITAAVVAHDRDIAASLSHDEAALLKSLLEKIAAPGS